MNSPNKRALTWIAFATVLLLPASRAYAQSLWYDITMAGKIIGAVEVLPDHTSGGTFTRTITSSFHVPLLYSGVFESVVRRVNGTLVEAQTVHNSGGKTKEKTQTLSLSTSGYQVSFYKSGTKQPTEQKKLNSIGHTLTDLYFSEPEKIAEAYSERYGEICRIDPISQSKYAVKLPTGKTSVYTYREGVCQLVELELSGIKLKIIKRDNRLATND